jgi:limonene 1,2-monooxygenase
MVARIKFGGFVAPHHPIGEHPTLQLQRDLELAEHLDKLGYDEFWCGEHHSTGWEVIASPELFLAAAGERTHRIGLGTGVISLPYHHPFNVAQRLVQLDHMTRGRVIFGSGPGALPSDAHTLGIDPMVQRDRQDEAIGVIKRLLAGEERFSYESEWFKMHEAKLQLLPLQEELPFAVASMVSPSGMTLAGKHGTGVLSIGSMSTAGLQALPNQWAFAEDAARSSGRKVNEYTVGTLMRPGAEPYSSPEAAVEEASAEGSGSIIGTPDDLIKSIREMSALTGGFGTVIGFAHDWANREATLRSWEMVARYVIPEVNGMLDGYRESQRYVIENRDSFERAGAAVMAKIMENEKAVEAMQQEAEAQSAMPSHHAPDLSQQG